MQRISRNSICCSSVIDSKLIKIYSRVADFHKGSEVQAGIWLGPIGFCRFVEMGPGRLQVRPPVNIRGTIVLINDDFDLGNYVMSYLFIQIQTLGLICLQKLFLQTIK